VESEEASELEAQKVRLEEEVASLQERTDGLKGTLDSILEDVERARQARREAKGEEIPPVDPEILKKEIEESVLAKVSAREAEALKQQVKLQNELIASKKVIIESINARMASASGSTGQPSSNSIVENEVELSSDEKEIAKEVGLKNPRYLKDVEVRGL
jgi:chromosome segregation ATPase